MISKKEVQHIAKLANLSLSEKEVIKFQKQLGDVLDYIEILNKLNTKKEKPCSQVTGLENIFKQDKVKKSFSQNQALSNAKSKYNGYFKIKGIFQE
ncbi:MAG: Asp-tRNA(Asn)/Glu-tRNA(Gln) amidotransferase subunit GatC [Candidatus Pacebacteria bacterium]|nr:Asp-tRNA(Asn)/Glu-tRNA(Gln) amidotransferase subunit GatC [Candidatus Paceibacterota bacterium]